MGGNPFTLLGINPIESFTGSISFDTAAAPILAQFNNNPGTVNEFSQSALPYTSYTVQFGTLQLVAAPSGSTSVDALAVRDGIGSAVPDRFAAQAGTTTQVVPGIVVSFSLAVDDVSDVISDILVVPSVGVLNSMPTDIFELSFIDEATNQSHRARYGSIVFSESTPEQEVPEPLTLSLFGVGLIGVAYARRRRLI